MGNYNYRLDERVINDANMQSASYATQQINTLIGVKNGSTPITALPSPTAVVTSQSVFSPQQVQDNTSRGLITPNTTTSTVGYDAILTQMSAIVFTYRGKTNDYPSMVNFFSNVSNVDAINSAINILGTTPSVNQGGGSTYDAGSPSMHKFYYLCQLLKQFPDVPKTASSCQAIQSNLTGLQNALTAQDATYASDKSSQRDNNNVAMTDAITVLTQHFNGLSSSLSCSLYLQDQSNTKDINAVINAANGTTGTTDETSTTVAATPNYALYIAIVLGLIVGTVVIIKVIKKKD
jgi:hypothetical protein